MTLGVEVGLGPRHIVLDGAPASAKGAYQPPPLFGPCLLWPRSPISATAELFFCSFPPSSLYSSCSSLSTVHRMIFNDDISSGNKNTFVRAEDFPMYCSVITPLPTNNLTGQYACK